MADIREQWIPTNEGSYLNPRHIVEARPSSVDGTVALTLVGGEHRTMALPQRQPEQQQQRQQPAPALAGQINEARDILNSIGELETNPNVSYARDQLARTGPMMDVTGEHR